MSFLKRSIIASAFLFLSVSVVSAATVEELTQQVDDLTGRVRQLEDYILLLKPNLEKTNAQMTDNFNNFQQGVNQNLQDFSIRLQVHLDDQIRANTDRVVVLDIISKEYRKIDANSGYFLIGIKKVQPLAAGSYRLTFHVGNPNFASYSGIGLNLTWGEKFDPESKVSPEQWRGSLVNAKFAYNAKLSPGTWTEFTVDVPAKSTKNLEYIECSLTMAGVELNLKKTQRIK
jgi:hypothetical protein